jgi:Ser/Thr protein kinase RdoA (MazF antagonist)
MSVTQSFFNPKKINSAYIADVVQQQYDIHSSILPAQMNGSVVNAAWEICGENTKYVYKVFAPDERNLLQQIQRELDLFIYLRSCNVEVPEIILSNEKKSITEVKQGDVTCLAVLMKLEKLVRVYPDDITDIDLCKLGQSLAQVHQACQSYQRTNEFPKWEYRPISPTLASFSGTPNESAFSAQEFENIQQLDQKIFNLPYQLPESLTKSLLHGDFGTEHAQFLPNGKIYIFDFGDACYGPVIVDLAIFFTHLYNEIDIKGLGEWKEMTDKILSAYEEVISLSIEERQVIPFIMVKRLTAAIIYLNNYSKKVGEQTDIEGNKKRYKLLSYLVEQLK